MISDWKEFDHCDLLVEVIINHNKALMQARVSEIVDDKYVCLAFYDELLEKIEGYQWFDATLNTCIYKPVMKLQGERK